MAKTKEVKLSCKLVDYIIEKKREDFHYFLTMKGLGTKSVYGVLDTIILDEESLTGLENMESFLKMDNNDILRQIMEILIND